MMEEKDLEKIMDDGDKIADKIGGILADMYGPDCLTKKDGKVFAMELGALGYAVNQIQTMISSLLIERLVADGSSESEAKDEISEIMREDVQEMVDLGLEIYREKLTILKKRPMSH